MRKEDIRNKVRKQLWSYYCENKLTYDNLYDTLFNTIMKTHSGNYAILDDYYNIV